MIFAAEVIIFRVRSTLGRTVPVASTDDTQRRHAIPDSVAQAFDACVWIQLSYHINGVTKAAVGDESQALEAGGARPA